jgi:hypothetical protein
MGAAAHEHTNKQKIGLESLNALNRKRWRIGQLFAYSSKISPPQSLNVWPRTLNHPVFTGYLISVIVTFNIWARCH